jgi:drug/metabolite transporter (DMT)-like permease
VTHTPPAVYPDASGAPGPAPVHAGASSPALPYLWMLAGSLSFSLMATLAHALADRCDWELVATVRAGLAFLFATALALRARARLVLLRPRILWVRSLAGTVSLLCTFYALPRLPIADVLTLTNMFPIWVAVLSWPLAGERPTRDAWAAIAVGILGVVLISQPHFAESRPLPALIALLASFSTSVAMLGLHRLRQIDPRAIVAHFSGVSFLACTVVMVIDPADSWGTSRLEGTTLAMLGGLGLSATVGQLFLTKAFAAGPPARVSVVALTQVAFALVFDALIWRHPFGLTRLAGIVLVLAPTAWLLITQRREADLSLEPPAS